VRGNKREKQMETFDKISNEYKNKALVQQKASLKLFELLKVGEFDDIIDVACGPGNITKWLADKTKGKVVGTDISQGMIEQARAAYPEIEFRQVAVQDLGYKNSFNIAFCNSSLQWFTEPDKSIQEICRCLKPKGKLGVACPGSLKWAPWFMKIVEEVKKHKEIADIFKHWKSPWWWLESEKEYIKFFERNGFKTLHIEIAYEEDYYDIEKAYNIYLSGAANGFTGKTYYDIEISDNYIKTFNNFAKEEMIKSSKNNKVKVDFNRMYYVGQK